MSTYKYQPMADPPQAEGSLNKLKYSGNKTPVTRGNTSGPCPDLRKERTPQKFFFASLPTFYACRVNLGQAEELVRGLISWISNQRKKRGPTMLRNILIVLATLLIPGGAI